MSYLDCAGGIQIPIYIYSIPIAPSPQAHLADVTDVENLTFTGVAMLAKLLQSRNCVIFFWIEYFVEIPLHTIIDVKSRHVPVARASLVSGPLSVSV